MGTVAASGPAAKWTVSENEKKKGTRKSNEEEEEEEEEKEGTGGTVVVEKGNSTKGDCCSVFYRVELGLHGQLEWSSMNKKSNKSNEYRWKWNLGNEYQLKRKKLAA